MTIGGIYKLSDAHPPAFGEVTTVTENKIWNEILEEDEQVKLAWADWYQWNDKNVYCMHGSGCEIERLVPATDDEIGIYWQKVEEYENYGWSEE